MTAPYQYQVSVDYHKSYSHLVVRDSNGKTLRSGRVKNDRRSLGRFPDRYPEDSHAVVEATRNWMVRYDWLDDICDDVVRAHPLKVKAIAVAKIKADKLDATVLAHLLRAGRVPETRAPSESSRAPSRRAARADVLRVAAHDDEEPHHHRVRPLSGADGTAEQAQRAEEFS
ncbi:transposase [Rhizobium leguminosarum]|uniref:IS110 family transposase n=1 Tax=Rhizobium leguminosarum TaxID=384 RepID=UPI0021B0E3FF|nr:transposase [Rhizobium leguminosarum]